ncbi:GNAT family N-acetyltransferase [Gilliamella sp. B2776]|uniref:GNAT family N-acetyltransferase n=1 Tax=Gilliamella sp. B3022 TaxID=2817969 RepID=UPI00279BE751|nr:GNAT family N-acetyltransferase [Gilliamella sp. B2779]MCX8654057.1 GNAT family N-acetyltransferase [Gilliamella sp. B2737]MCX8657296.1 GNAT family N-acetyltransferase [Gilliamella sp. B2894]MCX8665084.1 GNAT family N-acetyltransferase [Gilliamella sp. B2887]MCX8691312.1 GNAT family N-acetyltransferase [Gilliamella sp. B2776]MCX8693208.1 GNAT family N-acetyltransferase [Gilliamella sp. B2881]MCX8697099.1 GNAT family N-acetyltransferase [Gilliamella sp. B2828]MCX8697674.1 GNAT family N-ace
MEVDTVIHERQKGFALFFSTKLILAYLDRNISVNFDAHNQSSMKIATKLGSILNEP